METLLPASHPTMAEKKCIYVVDDELVIARTLSLILQHAGYDTSMFMNAEAVLGRMEELPPDLVLTDVVMSGSMNGLELAQQIAFDYPKVHVIIMSGQAYTSELLKPFYEKGLSPRVHPKPLSPKKLLNEIRSMLN